MIKLIGEMIELDEMSKSQLVAAIQSIVAARPANDTAGTLILAKIKEFMNDYEMSELVAIERLAELGLDYGEKRQLGGVNVYCDEAGEVTREVFTDERDSNRLTHHLTLAEVMLVNGYNGYPPLPFKPDWWLKEGTKDATGLPLIFGDPWNPVIYH